MNKSYALIGLGLLTTILYSNCKKDTVFMNTATIIGFDARIGVCDGGTYIKIDGHANPNDTTNGYYDIGSLPSSFQINNFTKFPIKVKLDWKSNPKCSGNYIDIERIETIY